MFYVCVNSARAFPREGPGFRLYAPPGAELPGIEILPVTVLGDRSPSLNAAAWGLQYAQCLTVHGSQLC